MFHIFHKYKLLRKDLEKLNLFGMIDASRTVITYQCEKCGKLKQEIWSGNLTDPEIASAFQSAFKEDDKK